MSQVSIEAWYPQSSPSTPLTSKRTNERGEFQITLPESVYLALSSERQPSLFFKIFRDGKLIKDNVPMPPFTPRITDTEIIAEIVLTVDLPAEEASRPELPAGHFLVSGLVTRNGKPLSDAIVRAFDKDLPSLRRNEEPLGEVRTDGRGYYEIPYTAERFSRAEKGTADLVVRIFSRDGSKLVESPVSFNAPQRATSNLNIASAPPPAPPLAPRESEYEQLLKTIAPLMPGLNLPDLTEADISFLAGDTQIEQRRIQILVIAAHRSLETLSRYLTIDTFYGLGRQGLPLELPALLELKPERLRRALEAASANLIIPPIDAAKLTAMLKAFDDLRGAQLVPVRRSVIGQLINAPDAKPLAGFKVKSFDLDAGAEPVELGSTMTSGPGLFTINYTVMKPRRESDQPETAARHIRLQISSSRLSEPYQTDVEATPDAKNPFVVRVAVPEPPKPSSPPIQSVMAEAKLDLPVELTGFLASKGIHTLSDVLSTGGLHSVEGLPLPADHAAVRTLEAHANMMVVSPDIKINADVINSGYPNFWSIAKKTQSEFVTAVGEKIGDIQAGRMYTSAQAGIAALGNYTTEFKVNRTNRYNEVRPGQKQSPSYFPPRIENAFKPDKCQCEDCNSAVSPLAYLADLLEYAVLHVKSQNHQAGAADKLQEISLQFLEEKFHQPFSKLPTDCKEMDKQVRQVRLCVEVLRSYLGSIKVSLPASDLSKYLIETYTALLTNLGTSYDELRLALNADDEVKKALADRLGITIDHLKGLVLNPADTKSLSEKALETIFGLVHTSRNPLAKGTEPTMQTLRLATLAKQWQQRDWVDDQYWTSDDLTKGMPVIDLPISDPQAMPVIDPDVIGPDDLRYPQDGKVAYDLWKKRRLWVDGRLDKFKSFDPTDKDPNKDPMPDIMVEMTSPVTYVVTSVITWASPWVNDPINNEPDTWLHKLQLDLAKGATDKDAKAAAKVIEQELRMSVEAFNRFMAIREKNRIHQTNPKKFSAVGEDEWDELNQILVQAQKVVFFPTWSKEEFDKKLIFGHQDFWISQREPEEGVWPPLADAPNIPLIDPDDPDRLKLTDLPEQTAGFQAIKFWMDRQTAIQNISTDLAQKLEAGQGQYPELFNQALTAAFAANLDAWAEVLKIAATADKARQEIEDTIKLSLDEFSRMMAIRQKLISVNGTVPTQAELNELIHLLTTAQKHIQFYPTIADPQGIWIKEEKIFNSEYWRYRKARLPRWRATAADRQAWQQALQARGKITILDPDLLPDISSYLVVTPTSPTTAFNLWDMRSKGVSHLMTQLTIHLKDPAGVAAGFKAIFSDTGLPGDPSLPLDITPEELGTLNEDWNKGINIIPRLDQLNLSTTAFEALLRMKRLTDEQLTILDEEWQEICSILVQVHKQRRYAEWRNEEKTTGVYLNPEVFKFPELDPLTFPLPAKPDLPDWRTNWLDRLDWEDTLQSRIEQRDTTISALQDLVRTVEATTMPHLRDALINVINPKANDPKDPKTYDLSAKAGWFTDHLLIDAKNGGCQMTTRIAQAIETMQQLLWQLRTGQLEDTYPDLVLDADQFDEEWKFLGSYATWRSAMFVFFYPEMILIPTLRRDQSPKFRQIVDELDNLGQISPKDAEEKNKEYFDYLDDLSGMTIEATCEASTQVPQAEKWHPLFYMFGRGGNTKQVYWSTCEPGNTDGKTDSFWGVVPGIEKDVVKIIGAVPYTNSNHQYLFLFVIITDKDTQKLMFTRYNLERFAWDSDPVELDVLSSVFTAVIEQTVRATLPPHIAVRLSDGAIYDRNLNAEGTNWEANDWRLLVKADAENSKLLAMADAQVFPLDLFRLFVSDSSQNIKYSTFARRERSDAPGPTKEISIEGGPTICVDRDGATLHMFAMSVDKNIWYQKKESANWTGATQVPMSLGDNKYIDATALCRDNGNIDYFILTQ